MAQLLAERDLDVDVLKEFLQKKVVTASERRQAVRFLIRRRLSRRRACSLVGTSRRWLAYQPQEEDTALVRLLRDLVRCLSPRP